MHFLVNLQRVTKQITEGSPATVAPKLTFRNRAK